MVEPSPRLASHLCHIWGKPWSQSFSPKAIAGSEEKLPWWGLQSSLCLQMRHPSSCLQNPSLSLDCTCEDQAPAARGPACEGGSKSSTLNPGWTDLFSFLRITPDYYITDWKISLHWQILYYLITDNKKFRNTCRKFSISVFSWKKKKQNLTEKPPLKPSCWHDL